MIRLGMVVSRAQTARSWAARRVPRGQAWWPGSLRQFSCANPTDQPASHAHAPDAAHQPFTITCPLYYANAAPHMGSAYSTIATDVFARYQRLRGRTVRFVVGTDEHGEKIAAAAAARGLEPKAHCDQVAEDYKRLWSLLNISYDVFIRTTDGVHERVVSEVLGRVWERDVYRAAYKGWYCVGCEEFKDELELEHDHSCPIHKKTCEYKEEDNYFFALSKYQQQLEDFLEQQADFVQPHSARNEVLAWVKAGLRDFSISRSSVTWGIPVPRDPTQTIYVWFDALVGYLSALLRGSGNRGVEGVPEGSLLAGLPAVGWPANVHVIGKDILRFHAVYWPAMLMSAGLPLPHHVFGHGFLTKDGLKMGKSLGNVLDPRQLVAAYGADAVRFFFMREIAFGSDGDFSEARFQATVNASLANDVGNLLSRTLGMLCKQLPQGAGLPVSASDVRHDTRLAAVAADEVSAARGAYEALQPHAACEAALRLTGEANAMLSELEPWHTFRKGTPEEKEKAMRALVAVLESLRITAVVLSPVVPGLSGAILRQLGVARDDRPLTWGDTEWGALPRGHVLIPGIPVFARIQRGLVTEPAQAARTGAP